jgi:hypothetical protein
MTTTCNLDMMYDVCKLSKCVIGVGGMKSNSASPTDTWFLDFKDTYYKGKKVDQGFLKLFVEWKTIPRDLIYDNYNIATLKGLNYEMSVYKDIIQNLTNLNICPNFIQYLGSTKRCTYDDVLKFLKNNIVINEKVLSETEIKPVLNENISQCLVKSCASRQSIARTNFIKDLHVPKELRYNMIINENIPPNTTSFGNWIYPKSRISNDVLWTILFQLAAACYAMSLSKLVHNDLHIGNIFIQELDKEKFFVYVINGVEYVIHTKYKIMLYDFDRAYAKSLGDNPLLSYDRDYMCNEYQQCNIFIPNKDFIKASCYLVDTYGKKPLNISFKNKLMDCISDNTVIKNKLLEIYNKDCHLRYFKINGLNKVKIFNECYKMEDILRNIFENIRSTYDVIDFVSSDGQENDVFVCDANFFKSDGKISLSKRKEIYDNVINNIYLKDLDSDINLDFNLQSPLRDGGNRPIPNDMKLYSQVTRDAKKKFKKWPSAYASAWVVKEYLRRGGKYSGKKPMKTGIKRWMDEKWINVCKLPKKVPCGRPKLSMNDWKKKYPYCRPSKRITANTPVITSELSKTEIKRRCVQKRKTPMKRVIVKKSKRKSRKSVKKSKRKKSVKKSKRKSRKSVKKSKRKSRKSVKKSKSRKSVKKSKRKKSVKKSKRKKSVKKRK